MMSSDNHSDDFLGEDPPMPGSLSGVDGDDGLPTAEDGDALADLLSVTDDHDVVTMSPTTHHHHGGHHWGLLYHDGGGFHMPSPPTEPPRLSSAATAAAPLYSNAGVGGRHQHQDLGVGAIHPQAPQAAAFGGAAAAPTKFPPPPPSHPILSNRPTMGAPSKPPTAAATSSMPPPPAAAASSFAGKMPPPMFHPHRAVPPPSPYATMNAANHDHRPAAARRPPAHYPAEQRPKPQFVSGAKQQRLPPAQAYPPHNSRAAGGAAKPAASNFAAARGGAAAVKLPPQAAKTKAAVPPPSKNVSLQLKASSLGKAPSSLLPVASKPPAASVKSALASAASAPGTLKSPPPLKSLPPKPAPKPLAYNNDAPSLKSSSDTDGRPLIDPKVVPAVHSIIALLQTYGPLSYEQLKFNMVPQLVPIHSTQPPPKPGQLPRQRGSLKFGRKRDRLQKVLDLLHELGVIHLVDKEKLKTGRGGSNNTAKLAKSSAAAASATKGGAAKETASAGKSSSPDVEEDDPNPVYCFGNGVPRMDVVLPCRILDEIREAGEEVLRMKRRIEILTGALRVTDGNPNEATVTAAAGDKGGKQPKPAGKRRATPTASKAKHAHAVLKRLHDLHPEDVVRDPVYAAALRMFKVDVGDGIDRHGMTADNTPEMEKVINAGINFNAGRFGLGKKRASGNSFVASSHSGGGGGGGVGGEGGSVKKKRKKGRPPKNAGGGSSDRLKGSPAEALAVHANASWI